MPNFIWVWIFQHIVHCRWIDWGSRGRQQCEVDWGQERTTSLNFAFFHRFYKLFLCFWQEGTREKKQFSPWYLVAVNKNFPFCNSFTLFADNIPFWMWMNEWRRLFVFSFESRKSFPSLLYVISLSCEMWKWLFRTARGRKMRNLEKKSVIFSRRSFTACIRTAESSPFCHLHTTTPEFCFAKFVYSAQVSLT